MEPHQLTPQERLDLYAAWYRILLRKLPNRASHGDEMLESLLDAGLHHFADTHSLPLSREHIAHWDPERLDRVYGHLFALAEKVFLQRFSPTETVSAARSLLREIYRDHPLPRDILLPHSPISYERLEHLLLQLTGPWLCGTILSPFNNRLREPLQAWRQSILAAFTNQYLDRLDHKLKLALAVFFEFILFDTVQERLISHGIAMAASSLCKVTPDYIIQKLEEPRPDNNPLFMDLRFDKLPDHPISIPTPDQMMDDILAPAPSHEHAGPSSPGPLHDDLFTARRLFSRSISPMAIFVPGNESHPGSPAHQVNYWPQQSLGSPFSAIARQRYGNNHSSWKRARAGQAPRFMHQW